MTEFETAITFDSPVMTADAILLTLYKNAFVAMTAEELTFAYCTMFIPKGENTIFAEVQINAETPDQVQFMVGVNADFDTDYPIYDYSTAVSILRDCIYGQAA